MADRFKIELTPAAMSDLNDIYRYIASDLFSPQAAERIMDEFEEAFEQLSDYPFMCPISTDESLLESAYRKLVVRRFVGLYRVDEQHRRVIFIRFMHGSRDYSILV